MLKNNEIKARQIGLFFIAFLPVTKIFIMPKDASNIANEDMWISILISLFLDAIGLLSAMLLYKKQGQSFYSIIENGVNKFFSKAILFLYFVFFLLKAFTPIYEQKNFMQNTLYETAPTAFAFAPFFILSIYLCTRKLRAIGRLSDLFWIFTVVGIILLTALSIESADFLAFLPIGANKAKIFKATYYITPWFCDAPYFLFMIGKFRQNKNSTKIIFLSFLASAFLTLIFAFTFYSVFTFIAGRELFALAEISKYSTVINSIGRIDYIGIFLLLLSGTISACLPIYFSIQILTKIFNLKNNFVPAIIVNLLFFIIFLFFEPFHVLIITFIYKIASPYLLVLANFLPFAFLFFKKKKTGLKINGEYNALFKN